MQLSDTLQDDRELAVALNAYSEARRRLSERFRNRGFWPIKPSKGKGKNFSKNKGKFSGGRKSLQDRILNSRCRICGKLGHWKSRLPGEGTFISIKYVVRSNSKHLDDGRKFGRSSWHRFVARRCPHVGVHGIFLKHW